MATDESKAIIQVSNAEGISLHDGLSNLATGLGGAKDKSTHNTWSHSGKNYDHISLSARYREDWISQKVCQIIPQDLTREWRKLEGEQAVEADKAFLVSDLFISTYSVASDQKMKTPNIVIIMSDDQGGWDYGFMGNKLLDTPNIDAMAARSARLSRFYVSPVCTPTRANLMT